MFVACAGEGPAQKASAIFTQKNGLALPPCKAHRARSGAAAPHGIDSLGDKVAF
jgi:hypothetical protein